MLFGAKAVATLVDGTYPRYAAIVPGAYEPHMKRDPLACSIDAQALVDALAAIAPRLPSPPP